MMGRRAILGLVLGLMMPAAVSMAGEPVGGPEILTVTGNVAEPNRGAVDPDVDKFFGYLEVEFDAARTFDHDALAKLPQATARADFPKGGALYDYSGPLLADVLTAAGASGETVTVQALDGYAVEAKLADLVAAGAIVALSRDGKPFGVGGFGPTQIVFPRAERAELADMPDDNWVWSVFHIRVE